MKDSRSTVFVKANSGDDIAGVERLNFDDLILLPQMGNVDGLVNDDAAARLAFCNHVYGLVAKNLNLGILVESALSARVAKHLLRIRLCNWGLAMIAGFIFLRLRGILGRRTGHEENIDTSFPHEFPNEANFKNKNNEVFDEKAKDDFLNGAKIAYETIITDFSDNDNKLIASKPLLSKKIFDEFNKALVERSQRGHFAEITFIGISSADIKEHKKLDKVLNVTVNFVSEIITCIRDKEKKIISGSPDKIKKIYDTWTFSRDTSSQNPNWLLINTIN